MKRCKEQKWHFGNFSHLAIFWCLLFLYSSNFFWLLLLPSGESDKQMYHLTAGVKAAPRGLLAPALGWSRAEAEELPVPCRQEELIPVVPPCPSPHRGSRQPRTVSVLELPLGLTLQNWPFIIFDTRAISESTALAHSGIIISKLGLCFASEGGHGDNNNASRVFVLLQCYLCLIYG